MSGNWTDVDRLYPGRQVRQFDENTNMFYPEFRTSILQVRLRIAKAFVEMYPPDSTFMEWHIVADEMGQKRGAFSLAELRIK